MDQPKKQPKVFTNNAAKVSVIPHIRNFYSLLVFSILIFLPVSSSYLLQFDNQTHQIISRLIAGERDQIIHSFIMNSLQDQQTILRECSGKEFNIQTGDSFYTVENYIVLGTYDIASPSHKKCTGMLFYSLLLT